MDKVGSTGMRKSSSRRGAKFITEEGDVFLPRDLRPLAASGLKKGQVRSKGPRTGREKRGRYTVSHLERKKPITANRAGLFLCSLYNEALEGGHWGKSERVGLVGGKAGVLFRVGKGVLH